MDRGHKDAAKTPRADAADSALAEADPSQKFLGEWNTLISSTNWEKGRIIREWRAELEAAGAKAREYSDDVWARRVGTVSSQHVGRLRRVSERFADVRETYAGLYWSHFQAALEWDDAEMWLEGAVQSKWSVSAMRKQRWETLGSVGAEPREEEIVAAEPDEDGKMAGDLETGEWDGETADGNPRVKTAEARGLDDGEEVESEEYDGAEEEVDGFAPADESEEGESAAAAAGVRLFESLPELPPDLSEAFESFKLAILRHKLAGWTEISRQDMVATLDALKQLALTPASA